MAWAISSAGTPVVSSDSSRSIQPTISLRLPPSGSNPVLVWQRRRPSSTSPDSAAHSSATR